MNYNHVLKYIYSLESPKIKLGLENVKSLLQKIGNPEKSLKCIHVAGSNGKGSTCAMIFNALKNSGCKVGLYTSPHLKRFNERIRINDKLISDREIVDYYLRIKPHITNQSFFEIATAIMFLHFYEKKVDYAVIEVGLGGRLDATNVITPLISVITTISLEHTNILGKTIKEIAREKAGIIKQDIPVVTGAGGKALFEIKKIAKEKNSRIYFPKNIPKIKFKRLKGGFQQQNAKTAFRALEILKNKNIISISTMQILEGIKKTQWPSRFQFIKKNVLIDCAHNPQGFKTISEEIKNLNKKNRYSKIIFVIGILKDKDCKSMLKTILPLADWVLFTKSKNERSSNPNDLKKLFSKLSKKKIPSKVIVNPKNALYYAEKISGKKDLVVVTGSIYMIGEVL
ncbi:MAG TPA: folylpolyglutamate synthase/dihydrofolate synthase family protein [Candidatus Nanoarchaeia archaeon]|nr:folylpolyglutamate synthase/dihydrofolate synthase family protein [Candidatus Nanoarchaeia archaeon]